MDQQETQREDGRECVHQPGCTSCNWCGYSQEQAIPDAVKDDTQARTYYWTGYMWETRPPTFSQMKNANVQSGVFMGKCKSFDLLPEIGNTVGDYYIVEPDSPVTALSQKQAILDAVKVDIEQRTYYWAGGNGWVHRTEFAKIGDPHLVTGVYKGTVPNVESLPKNGGVVGDYYVVAPSTQTIAMTEGRVMEGFGDVVLTYNGDQIKGELTMRGAVQNYHSDRITDHIRRFVITALTDERLVLLRGAPDGNEFYLLAASGVEMIGGEAVKSIEVNRLHVTRVSGFDGFGVVLSYNGRHVRIDSSAY